MTDKSANPAATDPVRDLVSRIPKMAVPGSVAEAIAPGSLRAVATLIKSDVAENASDEAVNFALLRCSSWYPEHFTASFPQIKSLTAQQKLEFANSGRLPRKRRGPTNV